MGFDATVRSESFGGADKSWLRFPRIGLDRMLPIMVDMSLFSASHLLNGRIPSGTALAKVLGGAGTVGFYGPFTGASGPVNEVQNIAVDATGGTWRITFQGDQTADLAFNITAANLKAALETLPDIDLGDITVSGGPGAAGGATPYVVTFKGQYAGSDVPAMTTQVTGTPPLLTGGAATAAVTTPTAGAVANVDGLGVLAGHLFEDIAAGHYPDVPNTDPSTHADVAAALYWSGIVLESKLPNFAATTGKVTAAGKAQLTTIRYT